MGIPPAEQLRYHLFEAESASDNKALVIDRQAEDLAHGKAVRCAYCKTVITYQGNAEPIQGRYVHSFINPGGYEFTIGCYRRAWCKVVGQPTLEWSWFNGHTWQYALCPQCQELLGWYYHAAATGSSFYGLILDRLIIEQSSSRSN